MYLRVIAGVLIATAVSLLARRYRRMRSLWQ